MKKVFLTILTFILVFSMSACTVSLEEKLENTTVQNLNEINSMSGEIEKYGGLYISCTGQTNEGSLNNESCLYISSNGNLIYSFNSEGVNEAHMSIKDGIYYYNDTANNEFSIAIFPIKKHNINTLYYLDYAPYNEDCLTSKYLDENKNFIFIFEYVDNDKGITEKSKITVDPSSLSALKEEFKTYDQNGELLSEYTVLLSHGEKKNVNTQFVTDLENSSEAFTVTIVDKDKNGTVISTRTTKVYENTSLFLQDVSQGYVAYTDEACTQKSSATIKVGSDCTYYILEK